MPKDEAAEEGTSRPRQPRTSSVSPKFCAPGPSFQEGPKRGGQLLPSLDGVNCGPYNPAHPPWTGVGWGWTVACCHPPNRRHTHGAQDTGVLRGSQVSQNLRCLWMNRVLNSIRKPQSLRSLSLPAFLVVFGQVLSWEAIYSPLKDQMSGDDESWHLKMF